MSIITLIFAAAAGMTITADRMAVDNITKAAVATGNVNAAYGPLRLRSDYMKRDEKGFAMFADPTTATTCTNDFGHQHWCVSGEVRYQADEYVILEDAWLKFYEFPIMYLPYLYWPTAKHCGFSWMVGYMGRWGAFVETKYRYDILGDPYHQDNTWWLHGDTRFDLRYKNGVALGEDLFWNLGDFGSGSFDAYYAWDDDAERRYGGSSYYVGNLMNGLSDNWNYGNWGSKVDRDRYTFGIKHEWEPTERDRVWVQATYLSDSYFRNDFNRQTFFNNRSRWLAYRSNGVFWEHLEQNWAFGAEAAGRLNEFYTQTERLPEFYFDVLPMSVFGTGINYESENRFGFLRRRAATYGNNSSTSIYANQPGVWADYEAFRLDTYHRFTMPMRVGDDLLSVVPRVAYRGTAWSETGYNSYDGWDNAGKAGEAFRSIGEAGVTFAARGSAMVDDKWRHTVEPYLDVLAQEAMYSSLDRNRMRPYVFDSLDASSTWEDQFAGRSRNLPYSYYGITPGYRNLWQELDEKGNSRTVLDFDVYLAAQFNRTTRYGYTTYDHALTEPGKPNYGHGKAEFVPGARVKWSPWENTVIGARAEYDSDENTLAYAELLLSQKLTDNFKWNLSYHLRDHRYWDFSSTPFEATQTRADEMDMVKIDMLDLSFEHTICDWLAWGPHIRWDLRTGELDTVGTWIDYMTDCLGFRLSLEYENEYTTVDGCRCDDEFSVGFSIYLRAFQEVTDGIFSSK